LLPENFPAPTAHLILTHLLPKFEQKSVTHTLSTAAAKLFALPFLTVNSPISPLAIWAQFGYCSNAMFGTFKWLASWLLIFFAHCCTFYGHVCFCCSILLV